MCMSFFNITFNGQFAHDFFFIQKYLLQLNDAIGCHNMQSGRKHPLFQKLTSFLFDALYSARRSITDFVVGTKHNRLTTCN